MSLTCSHPLKTTINQLFITIVNWISYWWIHPICRQIEALNLTGHYHNKCWDLNVYFSIQKLIFKCFPCLMGEDILKLQPVFTAVWDETLLSFGLFEFQISVLIYKFLKRWTHMMIVRPITVVIGTSWHIKHQCVPGVL